LLDAAGFACDAGLEAVPALLARPS